MDSARDKWKWKTPLPSELGRDVHIAASRQPWTTGTHGAKGKRTKMCRSDQSRSADFAEPVRLVYERDDTHMSLILVRDFTLGFTSRHRLSSTFDITGNARTVSHSIRPDSRSPVHVVVLLPAVFHLQMAALANQVRRP